MYIVTFIHLTIQIVFTIILTITITTRQAITIPKAISMTLIIIIVEVTPLTCSLESRRIRKIKS